MRTSSCHDHFGLRTGEVLLIHWDISQQTSTTDLSVIFPQLIFSHTGNYNNSPGVHATVIHLSHSNFLCAQGEPKVNTNSHFKED